MFARLAGRIERHPGLTDAFFALVLISVTIVVAATLPGSETENTEDLIEPTAWWHWLVLVLPAVAVAFRRKAPVPALAIATLATMVTWAAGLPDFVLATGVLIYSAVVHREAPVGRRAAIASAAALTLFTLSGVMSGNAPLYALPIVALTTGVAVAIGMTVATNRDLLNEHERRAKQVGLQRISDGQQAITEERARIARELHDVVAHGLSVIVVQASAGQRILDTDADGARRSLEQIEEAARSSLTDMRQVLGVLRTSAAEARRPTPGVSSLADLLDDYASNGLHVDLEIEGEVVALSNPIETSVYRIVEEALTNVLKHAGPKARATVSLDYDDERLRLAIVDDGRGAAAAQTDGGHGLIGMRERVDVLQGEIEIGPTPGGGFQVLVELPLGSRTLQSAPRA